MLGKLITLLHRIRPDRSRDQVAEGIGVFLALLVVLVLALTLILAPAAFIYIVSDVYYQLENP